MKRSILSIALALVTACSGTDAPTTTQSTPLPSPTAAPRTNPPPTVPTTPQPDSTGATIPRSTTSQAPRTPTTTSFPTPAPTPTVPPSTPPPPARVSAPGTYTDGELEIRLAFESRVDDVTAAELESAALATLNSADGWSRAGFTFVPDGESDLRVILAEGPEVDELCLPLDTKGTVSCQNGAVVALNADRWRTGARRWDSTVEAYRVYLINHEVGHLIGLRHPRNRCPGGEPLSAVMEPQTNNPASCAGNGIPLAWELEWAGNRPVVVGPTPDWDGPRPVWPELG